MDDSLSAGLLLIRFGLGVMLMVHGTNKVFGPGGIDGTAGWFEGLGLRPGRFHAWTAAITEITAGALMCAGMLFPGACAAFVGLMTVAALTDHRGKGFFIFKGGWEYVAVVGVSSVALAFTGPGAWSLDHVLGLHLHGAAWGVGVAALGVAAALALVSTMPKPLRKSASA